MRWKGSSVVRHYPDDVDVMLCLPCCVQATYEKLEGELKELNSSIEALRRNQGELQELRHVLQHTDSFLAEVGRLFKGCGYWSCLRPRWVG